MGMTDLQFKSFLKMLIRALETAEKQGNKEDILAEISRLKHELQEDLQKKNILLKVFFFCDKILWYDLY